MSKSNVVERGNSVKLVFNVLLALLVLIIFSGQSTIGQTSPTQTPEGAAVVVKGKRLFYFYSNVGEYTPRQRAIMASQVLQRLAEDPDFDVDSVRVQETSSGTDIVSGSTVIATVTPEDAKIAQSSTTQMANEFASRVRLAVSQRREATSASSLALAVGLTVAATVILLLSLVLVSKLAADTCWWISRQRGQAIKGLKIQNAELIGANALADLFLTLVKFLQILFWFSLFATYIVQVLGFYPSTKHLAKAVMANAVAPLASIWEKVLEYFPSLVILVLIILVTYAVIGFARFFFDSVRDQTIKFADFDPDWAEPTYKLSRFLILAFAMMVAMPYLPGWDSPAFKQVGLVIGILVSFGSTGVVSNVMAGAVLTYTNAFKFGDRVKIADTVGDIVEKNLFVTKVRTPKNEVVSIPNGTIMTTNVTNYSTLAREKQLILYTSVTIGYDEPWQQVEACLMAAAADSYGLLKEPKPFILQNELADFYVDYQLNVYTELANEMPLVYSELHKRIQDKFNEAGMEIMSPHIFAVRDGNEIAIPKQYRGENYKRPTFGISQT
ncbi:MAG: mechanosensitive ion channel family protein [Candidatus Obscuribacterales bacterium]|nr:mechanosensitive ion channel family protein [Candidatus Obscuribacterales bacterium]